MSIAPKCRAEKVMSTIMDQQNGGLVNQQIPNSDVRITSIDDVEMGTAFPYSKRSKSFAIGLGSTKGSMERYGGFPPRRIMSLPMGTRPECFVLEDDILANHKIPVETCPQKDEKDQGPREGLMITLQTRMGTSIRSIMSRWTDSSNDGFDIESVADTLSLTNHDGVTPPVEILHRKKVEIDDGNKQRLALDSDISMKLAIQEEQPSSSSTSPTVLLLVDDWIRRKIQYVYVLATLYVTPVCIAVYAPSYIVSILYYLSIGCVAFVNFWMVLEVISAFQYTSRMRKLHHSSPEIVGERRLGSIVAAYLPNELTVLIDTVKAVANTIHELQAGTTLDIVLAHNGGKKDQRIALLEDLRKIEADLPINVCVHELHVVSSRSKAENVNAALVFFQELGAIRGTPFTQLSMYDADHQPIPQAWRYALETMQDQQADMVMGRCCVRDGLKYVAVEFDILYSVGHAGGRCVRGFGFFGGSNGYWDYNTLVETGMDEGMLTEDVDSSFRAQASGHKMTYDPTIVSFEESPPDFAGLFKQRLRWAQGWYEVTIRQFFLPFRQAPGLTLWSRVCIFLLLPFRELYVYLSSFTVPIAVVYLTRSCGWECVDYRLLALLIFCVHVPIFMTFAAWYLTKDRTNGIHYRMPELKPWDYFRYLLISFPYELFKIHVTVMGHARHALGLNKWVVTKRKTTKDPSAPIFTPAADSIANPEDLVDESPYAPTIRRLFAGTFDTKRTKNLVHRSSTGRSCEDDSDSSMSLASLSELGSESFESTTSDTDEDFETSSSSSLRGEFAAYRQSKMLTSCYRRSNPLGVDFTGQIRAIPRHDDNIDNCDDRSTNETTLHEVKSYITKGPCMTEEQNLDDVTVTA